MFAKLELASPPDHKLVGIHYVVNNPGLWIEDCRYPAIILTATSNSNPDMATPFLASVAFLPLDSPGLPASKYGNAVTSSVHPDDPRWAASVFRPLDQRIILTFDPPLQESKL